MLPDARALLDAVPGVVVLIDALGTVLWISDQVTALSGHQPAEIIGTNMLEHVDVEANPLALESIGYALDHTGVQLPTVLGFRARSGATIMVEAVANNQFADPVIGALVVHLRSCDERQLVDRVLASLAAADDLDVVFGHVRRVAEADTLQADTSIVLLDAGTGGPVRTVAFGPRTERLARHTGPSSPWGEAAAGGRPVLLGDLDPLPAAIASDAAAAGYQACWAYPIAHLEGRGTAGVLVLWRRQGGWPEPSATMLADELVRLASLAIDRHERRRELLHAARHDHLTGLANRAELYDVLGRLLADPSRPVGVLYVDLDRFKQVNDHFGHGHGDRVLQSTAARLADVVGAAGTAARLGGDEFAVCVPHATERAMAQLADRLVDVLARPISIDGRDHEVGATIGLALDRPGPDRSGDRLVDRADAALLLAKGSGRGTWQWAVREG